MPQRIPNSCAIIVPAYNKAPYVNRTLENLSRIAEHGYRTIIVDDASTDGTGEIIEDYAAKHPEIETYFMPENGKKVGAQKAVLHNLPSGIETVIMLDSDSFIKNPGSLKSAVSELYKDRKLAGGVFSLQPEGSGIWKGIQDVEYAMAEGMRKFTSQIGKIRCASGAGAIYKRPALDDALEKHSGEFLGDDFELTTMVQDKGYNMKLLPQVKVGTYVPDKWKERIKQLERWIGGGWRVWENNPKELFRQMAKPNRFAFLLGLELTAPVALASTLYGLAEGAKRFDFNSMYLASTAGWSALNLGIVAYGGADKKTLAKTALVSPLMLPLTLATYLPATVLAAGKAIKNALK